MKERGWGQSRDNVGGYFNCDMTCPDFPFKKENTKVVFLAKIYMHWGF
jgi:hypothetical protein